MKSDKNIYSPYQIEALKKWKKYLEDNTEILKSKFRKIIERYNFDNLKNLPGREKDVVEIEFSHGSGELDFVFRAKTYDDEFDDLFNNEYLFPPFDFAHDNNFVYPPELDIYYEGHREFLCEAEKRELLFTWIAKNWIECGGQHIGIVAGTWENNSASTFSLNYFNWDFCIDIPEGEKGVKINYQLNRELSDFEIRSRTKIPSFQAFRTYWRYFEKGEEFYEIGLYESMMSIRKGKIKDFSKEEIQSEWNFDSRGNLTNQIAKRCDELIDGGFYEKERPSALPKMRKDLIEWDFGYVHRKNIIVNKEEFDAFESLNNIFLPSSYKWFISKMNEVRPHWHLTHFRIGFEDWKKIEEIHSFKNLLDHMIDFHSKNNVNKNLLPIFTDSENGILLLEVKVDRIFYFSEEKELIDLDANFEFFIDKYCTGISTYFNWFKYHVEKGNAITIKKWFDDGGKITDEGILSKRSILQDTSDIKVTKVLLENGADPNKVYIYADSVTREYIDLLFEHKYDLEAKMLVQPELEKYFRRRPGFEDLLK